MLIKAIAQYFLSITTAIYTENNLDDITVTIFAKAIVNVTGRKAIISQSNSVNQTANKPTWCKRKILANDLKCKEKKLRGVVKTYNTTK